jgi:LysR family transcriptional regulator, transcriptional activator for dmlA
MNAPPDLPALSLFCTIARHGSLSAAAREWDLSLAAVSKRLRQLEDQLGVRLINRTTRTLSLTEEGELAFTRATQLLADWADLTDQVSAARAAPRGLVRVNATFGLGRRHIAPLIGEFADTYPAIQVQLSLTDRPINLAERGYDIDIRVGAPADSSLVARHLAHNRRMLVATPAYWAAHGMPQAPDDLTKHNCIVLRDNEAAFSIWRFFAKQGAGAAERKVRVNGSLASNDGEVVMQWVLQGRGVALRSEWDVAAHIAEGRLVQGLPKYQGEPADIYAVYLERQKMSARVRVFVDFLAERLGAVRWGEAKASTL